MYIIHIQVRVPMVGLTGATELSALAATAVGPVVTSGKELNLLAEVVQPLLEGIAQNKASTLRLREWARSAGSAEFKALYLRSYTLASSRSIGAPDSIMVPVLDLLNHSNDDKERNCELAFAPRAFKVVTSRAIEKGEQLLFSYGELSDAEFLASWGFVENLGTAELNSNPSNWVALPSELILQILKALPEGSDTSKFAARKPALEMLLSDARVTASEPLPLSLFTAVQLLFMDDTELAEWKSATNAQCAPMMLAPEDLEADILLKVLQTILLVADEAISARGNVDGDVKSGESYLLKATRFVLEGEAALLVLMRKAAVMHMQVLGEGSDSEGDDDEDEKEEREAKKTKRGEKGGGKKSKAKKPKN